ncbi:hypothetical protein C0989_001684, partial [Termitomyces sp. Mn162]
PVMVAPRDLERFLAGPGYLDTTRAEDFHLLSVQAQHGNLIHPAWLQSVFVLVLGVDSVEVASHDAATTPGLAQVIGHAGSKARAGKEGDARNGHIRKVIWILGVSDQEGSAHSGIGKKRGAA